MQISKKGRPTVEPTDQGSLEVPLIHCVLPLERGIDAYQAVAAGAEARIVIEP